MTQSRQIFLFDDHVQGCSNAARNILLRKSNALLAAYLRETYKAIRQEIAKQPSTVQNRIPEFASFIELVDRYYDGDCKTYAPLEYLLLSICQIGGYIV